VNLGIFAALVLVIQASASIQADLSSSAAEHVSQVGAQIGNDTLQNLNQSKDILKRAAAQHLEKSFNDTAERLHQGINNTTEHLQARAQNEFKDQVDRRAQPGMGTVLALIGLLAIYRFEKRLGKV
jgi:hypothetical protein